MSTAQEVEFLVQWFLVPEIPTTGNLLLGGILLGQIGRILVG